MSKPAIKHADPFEYAAAGSIRAACGKRQDIELDVHFCTVYLSQPEALRLVYQLLHIGQQQWGQEWREQIHCYLEQEM